MTVDKQKLKAAAEACGPLPWRFEQMSICKFGIRDDHGYIAFLETGHPAQYGSHPDREAKARFLGEMTPATALALIAENERMTKIAYAVHGAFRMEILAERDQLKAENEVLKETHAECAEFIDQASLDAEDFEVLRKDAERYRRMRLATLKQLDETPDQFDAEFDRQLDATLGKGEPQ